MPITQDQRKILELLRDKKSKSEAIKALLPEKPSKEDIKRKINVIN